MYYFYMSLRVRIRRGGGGLWPSGEGNVAYLWDMSVAGGVRGKGASCVSYPVNILLPSRRSGRVRGRDNYNLSNDKTAYSGGKKARVKVSRYTTYEKGRDKGVLYVFDFKKFRK